MNDAQTQALQRFAATLFAEVITLVIGALSNPELSKLIVSFTGEGSLVTTLLLALIPPIILALGKLTAGPTQKVPKTADGRRGAAPAGEGPGLFG